MQGRVLFCYKESKAPGMFIHRQSNVLELPIIGVMDE